MVSYPIELSSGSVFSRLSTEYHNLGSGGCMVCILDFVLIPTRNMFS